MSGTLTDLCLWLLAMLLGLQIKHVVADYALQTPFMLKGKGIYGHPGGILHAVIHGALTAVILLVGGLAVVWVLALSLAEIVVHYHLDWAKERWMSATAPGSDQRAYWVAMGIDQFLHQITYLALVAVAVCLL